MHVSMYACVYVCIYVCMYLYIHTALIHSLDDHRILPSVTIQRREGCPRCVVDSRELLNVFPKLETESPSFSVPMHGCIVHTVRIVASGYLPGAQNVSQPQKLSLFDDCQQKLLTHSLKDPLIPNLACSLDADHVAITTCCKGVKFGSHSFGQ